MKTNQKPKDTHSPVWWTLSAASNELNLDRRTIAKRLRVHGARPRHDGKYRAKDTFAAVYDDIYRARLRKMTAEADQIELENAKAMDELVPAEIAVRFCLLEAERTRTLPEVCGWELTPQQRAEWLREFREKDTHAILQKVLKEAGCSDRVWKKYGPA